MLLFFCIAGDYVDHVWTELRIGMLKFYSNLLKRFKNVLSYEIDNDMKL